MKKKKQNNNKDKNLFKQWQFWVAMLVIVGVIVLIEINLNETEFEITKEECRNETYLNYSYHQEIHRKIEIIEYYHRNIGCDYIKEMNTSNICYNNTLCAEYEKIIKFLLDSIPIPKKITEEICEPVEVEEIEFDKETMWSLEWENIHKYFKCIWNCEDLNRHLPLGKNVKKCDVDEECNYLKPTLSKQDLTIEWLDENCKCYECVELIPCEGTGFNMCSGEKEIDTFSCICTKCQKYKCIDSYYVKVE